MPYTRSCPTGGRPRTRSRSSCAWPGATFHDRYTERLSDTDLRKAIYVYATADTVVGRLAEPELRFLQDNEATVIPGDGANHYNLALDQAILDRIHEALQEQP